MYRGGVVVAALLIVAVPRVADACSCGPETQLLRPANGEFHPANAGLLFDVYCGSLVPLYSVAVDQTPATLLADEDIWIGFDVVRIDPQPAPGQEVVVSRCTERLAYNECAPESPHEEVLRFVARDADDLAPPDAGEAELTHDDGDFNVGGCFFDPDFVFRTLVAGLDQGDETDIVWTVTVGAPDSGDMGVEQWQTTATPASLLSEIYRMRSSLAGAPEEYCATVSASDLSGNEVTVAQACASPPSDT